MLKGHIMLKSARPGIIGILGVGLGLVAAPASADTINWVGNGTNNHWNDPGNWEGGDLPGSGDVGVIGDGFEAVAPGNLADDPAIEVHGGGTLQVADGNGTDISGMSSITIQNGATLTTNRTSSTGGVGTGITLLDGSTHEFNSSQFHAASNTLTLPSGTVTYVGDGRIYPSFVGNGTIDYHPTTSTDALGIAHSPDFDGDIRINNGILLADRTPGAGSLTNGTIELGTNTAFSISFRGHEAQPFADTTNLVVGSGATVEWTYTGGSTNAGSVTDTLNGMIIDGDGVAAGTYLLSELNSFAGRTVFTENFGGEFSDSVELTVLTTIPEPASAALAGVGALLILARRRRH